YRVTRNFKGKLSPNREITVNYAFHDGTACLPPPNFHFSSNMLPAKGSRWILFLHQGDGLWLTYRGDYGRKASTPELVRKVAKRT
ncbi:unnamed protein product, partial [Phaeothamnion confervicola]